MPTSFTWSLIATAKKGVSSGKQFAGKRGLELESTEVLKRRNKRYLPEPLPSHGFSIFTRFSLAFRSSNSLLSGWSNSFRPLCPSILSIFSLEKKNCMDKLGTSRKNFCRSSLKTLFDFSFLIPLPLSRFLWRTLLSFVIRLYPKCMFLDRILLYSLEFSPSRDYKIVFEILYYNKNLIIME